MVPVLPMDAVRAAVADERFDDAGRLLDAHQSEVARCLASDGIGPATRAAWQALLDAQAMLVAELRAGRDAAAAALAHGAERTDGADARRATRGWLRELA